MVTAGRLGVRAIGGKGQASSPPKSAPPAAVPKFCLLISRPPDGAATLAKQVREIVGARLDIIVANAGLILGA